MSRLTPFEQRKDSPGVQVHPRARHQRSEEASESHYRKPSKQKNAFSKRRLSPFMIPFPHLRKSAFILPRRISGLQFVFCFRVCSRPFAVCFVVLVAAGHAVASDQSPITNHLSPITFHLSPFTSHLSPLTSLCGGSLVPFVLIQLSRKGMLVRRIIEKDNHHETEVYKSASENRVSRRMGNRS
jgi:hypothetical protein